MNPPLGNPPSPTAQKCCGVHFDLKMDPDEPSSTRKPRRRSSKSARFRHFRLVSRLGDIRYDGARGGRLTICRRGVRFLFFSFPRLKSETRTAHVSPPQRHFSGSRDENPRRNRFDFRMAETSTRSFAKEVPRARSPGNWRRWAVELEENRERKTSPHNTTTNNNNTRRLLSRIPAL